MKAQGEVFFHLVCLAFPIVLNRPKLFFLTAAGGGALSLLTITSANACIHSSALFSELVSKTNFLFSSLFFFMN